jgi:hypothetical protein
MYTRTYTQPLYTVILSGQKSVNDITFRNVKTAVRTSRLNLWR